MRHHSKIKKFGRKRDQRNALLRSLALSLIKNGKIETTITRAKAMRPLLEKLVTSGKGGTLHARRRVSSRLGNNKAGTKKIMGDISSRYAARKGGYTRIVKSARRLSDGSQMAIVEFVK